MRLPLWKLLLFCSVLACLVLGFVAASGEVLIRWAKRDVAFQPDPDSIRSLRPDVDREIWGFDTEKALVEHVLPPAPVRLGRDSTNNLGLRMAADVGLKQPDEHRILLFGDSYTEATRIGDDARFYHVLEREVRQRHGEDWTVVNAGIQNGAPSQYILMARRLLDQVEPDIVIVVSGGNDLMDDLEFDRSYGFVRDEEGLPVGLARAGTLRCLQRSWLLRYLHVLAISYLPGAADWILPPARPEVEVEPWQRLYCRTDAEIREKFASTTGVHLRGLQRLSQQHGADFAVYLIHYMWSFDDEPFYFAHFPPSFRDELARWGCDSKDVTAYDDFMDEFLSGASIRHRNSHARFADEKQRAPGTKLWGFDDYHFSAAGHRVVGSDLAALVDEVIAARPTLARRADEGRSRRVDR